MSYVFRRHCYSLFRNRYNQILIDNDVRLKSTRTFIRNSSASAIDRKLKDQKLIFNHIAIISHLCKYVFGRLRNWSEGYSNHYLQYEELMNLLWTSSDVLKVHSVSQQKNFALQLLLNTKRCMLTFALSFRIQLFKPIWTQKWSVSVEFNGCGASHHL